ncbi:MAG: T9SS type A sorting domain-containing protein [Bacteroidetes bacterium]|nr:T9SS type A sorting domain-containing protein [Bacteroidota bacterium]
MGILTLFSGLSWGQFMSGYPSMTRANPSSGEWYADDNRAQVTTITAWGANMKLNLSNISGSFSASNRAIVIQMIGSSTYIGHWEEVDIINVNPSGDELEVSLLSRGYSTADPNDRVQVIQLEQFGDLTLDKVFVKCHPWDGNTGGVLALKTNSITMKSSVITAAGCGFKPEDGYSFGKGGQGAPGDIYYDGVGGGESAQYNEPCLDPDPSPNNKHSGNQGTDGDPQVSSSVILPTPANGMYTTYPVPSASTGIAIMGNAGYIETGINKGGIGGNGGGHGGTGGGTNAPTPVSGNAGSVGSQGGKGGNQGRGARGGGIILLKTKYIEDGDLKQRNISRWLDVSGANGENGEPGLVGGDPGAGGFGGFGTIIGTDVYYSGGMGGSGEPGDAAGGGDGSYGGAPGTIQLAGNPILAGKSQFFENFGVPFDSKWIGVSPGKNGVGGRGAYKLTPIDPLIQLPSGLGGIYEECSLGGGGGNPPPADFYTFKCDCDSAMYPFTLFDNSIPTYHVDPNNSLIFEDLTNVPDWKIKYDKDNGKLISIDEVNKIKYHCRLHYKGEATEIINAIAGLGKRSRTNQNIKLPAIKVTITADHFTYIFFDEDGNTSIVYESDLSDLDHLIQKIDFDAEDGRYSASYSRCNPLNPPSEDVNEPTTLDDPIMEDSGPDGNTPSGHVGYGQFYDHYGFDFNSSSMIPDNNQNNTSGINIRHNSITNEIRVADDLYSNPDVEATKVSMQCEIYDLSGRLISSYTTFEPSIQINTRTLSVGVYILKVIKGSRMATSRIIVE